MKALIVIDLLLALAIPASAHQGGHDVRGVVSAVSAQQLTVKTGKGSESFVLTPQTEFVKDGAPASAQDVHESDRVVVHARKKGGRMEAIKVESATPKRK